MESSSLRSYVVTFGPGPLGLVLLNVHRHAVVSRWQCQADGTPGQASKLGVTIGSLVVGIAVDGEDIKETKPAEYDTIRKALMFGPRPMRVVFQRLRCVLTPMPVPLPLVVWSGALTVSRVSSPTLVSVLSTGGAQLTLAKSVHSRGYHAVVTWLDSGLVLDVLDYSNTVADSGPRKLHGSVSALHVEGRLAASTADTLADDRLEGFPELKFASDVQNLQLAFDDAHACSEFRRVLLSLRFPADIEAQAHGLSKPELLLAGELCLWRSYLKSPPIGRWKRYFYRLISDGSLQVRTGCIGGPLRSDEGFGNHTHPAVLCAAGAFSGGSCETVEADHRPRSSHHFLGIPLMIRCRTGNPRKGCVCVRLK
jgi:hypothetical protein